jgi:signal transduction histidine kinase
LAEQVMRLLTGQAKKRGVQLMLRLTPDNPLCLVDQGQIKQVFMNLLMNALQATPAGGSVTLSTFLVRGLDGRSFCAIDVQDTGSGISPEHKEQIFDPFFKTKDSGVGLGLFITHQIVEELGGSITVESELEKGTCFMIRLPVAQGFASETVVSGGDLMATESSTALL